MWASSVWLQLVKNVDSSLLPLSTAAAPCFLLAGHAMPPLWLCTSDKMTDYTSEEYTGVVGGCNGGGGMDASLKAVASVVVNPSL